MIRTLIARAHRDPGAWTLRPDGTLENEVTPGLTLSMASPRHAGRMGTPRSATVSEVLDITRHVLEGWVPCES